MYNLYTRKDKKFAMDLGGVTADETGAAGVVLRLPMRQVKWWIEHGNGVTAFFFCFFSQAWERVRTQWRVVGGSSLHKSVEEIDKEKLTNHRHL